MEKPALSIPLLGGFAVARADSMVPTDAWRLGTAMRPLATGGTYVNCLGVGGARVRDCYDAERYARRVELKRRWDPTNAFHLNQNIAPAPAGSG